MGVAAYNRGSRLIRDQINAESKKHQPAADRAAEYENTARRNERLVADIESVRAELEEARQALKLEMTAHEKTIERAAYAAQVSSTSYGALMRSYSECSERLFKIKPLTKYEGMLLSCEEGGFVLVHPSAGGLGSFATMEAAQAWAAKHGGFVKTRTDYHDFHGSYHRVGFDIWPTK